MNKNNLNMKSGISLVLAALMVLSSLYTLSSFTATAYGAELGELTEEEPHLLEGEDVWKTDDEEQDVWKSDDGEDVWKIDDEKEDGLQTDNDGEDSQQSGEDSSDDDGSNDSDSDDNDGVVPDEISEDGELEPVLADGFLDDFEPTVVGLIMQDIKVTDPKGNPLQEPIYADEDVRVTYWFSLAENAQKGDMAYITLPVELRVQAEVEFQLKLEDGTVALSAHYDNASHQLVLVFETDLDADEVSGLYVYFDGDFDEEEIDHEGETKIVLGTNSDGDDIHITVAPSDVTITITKMGQFLGYLPEYEAYVVEWTLLVNQEERKVSNVEISDALPAGLTYIDGSFSAAPSDISWDTAYNSSAREITIANSGTISQMYTMKFLAEIEDFKVMPTTTINKLTYYVAENTAKMKYDTYYGIKEDSDTTKVNANTNLLFKSGEYNYDTKSIEWELVVNQDKMSILDAALSDTLPEGLILDVDSIEIYRANGSEFESAPLTGAERDAVISQISSDENEFQISFTSPLDNCYKITYSTYVDPDFFNQNGNMSYVNKAVLTGHFKGGLGGPFIMDVPVDAYSVLLKKTNGGYTQDTQTIKWNIAVNGNKIDLSEPVTVQDTLDSRVTYLPNTLVVKANGVTLLSSQYRVTEPDESNGRTLTVVFLNGLSKVSGSIYFETRVSDLNVLTSSPVNIPNHAELWYDDNLISSSDAQQTVNAKAIQKDVADYDYTEKSATWQVNVNPQLWPLTGAGNIVTDTLPVGMILAEDGLQYRIGSSGAWLTMTEEIGGNGETYTYSYNQQAGTIVFHLKDLYEKEVQIRIKTVITEEYLEEEFITNGVKPFTNKAELYVEATGKTASANATFNMENTVVGKSGKYSAEEGYIRWQIVVNSNALDWDMGGALISDELQEGLELDTSSVTLTKHSLNPNGSYSEPLESIALTGANVQYDISANLFKFTFPDDLDWEYVYVLTFDTYVLQDGKYRNSVLFEGTIRESDETEEMVINVSGGGGGITLNERKYDLEIAKVDEETGQPVEGARIGVLDQYGNVFVQGTTDEYGSLTLPGILYRNQYTLAELAAPDGYVPLDETVSFIINKSDNVVTVKAEESDNIKFAVTGQKVTVTAINRSTYLNLVKVDSETGEALSGVTFTLTEAGASSADFTAKTDGNGKIRFKALKLNTEYTLEEAGTADGYIPLNSILKLMLVRNESGQVTLEVIGQDAAADGWMIDGDTLTISLTNAKTELILKKISGEDGCLLPGAVFEICEENASEDDEPLIAETNGQGEAVIKGLKYNVIYKVKELKAPAGYITVEDFRFILMETYPETITVPEDVVIIVINEEKPCEELDVTDEPTRVQIEKIRQARPDVKLAGAVFAVYEGQNLVMNLAPTDTQGFTEAVGLEYDVVYRLRETKAPSGYRLTSDILFRLVAENTPPYTDEDGVLVLPATRETLECPAVITVENRKKSTGGGGENPGGENPGGENPGGENPGGENPGGENPGGENPGGENPGGENPGGENPGGENPGGENPGGENPGGENPGGENPGGEKPTGEKPNTENPGGGYDPSPQTGVSQDRQMIWTLLAGLLSAAAVLIRGSINGLKHR